MFPLPSDTATFESWRHDLRQRAEQLTPPRKHRPRPRGVHQSSDASLLKLPRDATGPHPRKIRHVSLVSRCLGAAGCLLRCNRLWVRLRVCHLSAGARFQDRQAAFPLFSLELITETSLQAGMTRCYQVVSSLAHDGQATHVVAPPLGSKREEPRSSKKCLHGAVLDTNLNTSPLIEGRPMGARDPHKSIHQVTTFDP